jgi:hypothetical protein
VRIYLVYRGDSVELRPGEIVIGRDAGCHLRFNDPAVSRRHVRIVRRRDEVFVEDLQSTNGTLVNGQVAAAPVVLRNGDVVAIGTRELTVLVVEAAGKEPPTVELGDLSALIGSGAEPLLTAQFRVPDAPPPSVGSSNQRCPRCGAAVSQDDDACASCHYAWGSFRVHSPTLPTANVLARRDPARLPVELHVVYISSELEVEATTRDLSTSGVLVCSQVLDPVGTTCKLTILADGMSPLQVEGVVRRVVAHERPGGAPVGMGVEFVGIGTRERAWLEAVVARLPAG